MIQALQLPSETRFLTADDGKRLKLTAPVRIIEEAHSQNLDAALVVLRQNTGDLIRQFEENDDLEEELSYRGPHRFRTGKEIVKFNAYPIQIHIWCDDRWIIAERKVGRPQTEARIRYHVDKSPGLRPFDFEGSLLTVEGCFDSAQMDTPPTVYLARPEQAWMLFPIEL
jgi:hypothetical protein